MSDTDEISGPKFPEEPIDAIATPFQRFIRTETTGGVVLLLAAIIALVAANSALGPGFDSLWTMTVALRIDGTVWDYPLRHWINDGLVTLFFFVVGLEIKRELVGGELSEPGAAALPVFAAVGGMIVPAALYLALASGPQAASGWGVVMELTLLLLLDAWHCLVAGFPIVCGFSCCRWRLSTTSVPFWSLPSATAMSSTPCHLPVRCWAWALRH